MRFDPDLARQILLQAEATPANEHIPDIEIEGVDENLIYEHIETLADAGLVQARIQPSGMGGNRIFFANIVRITHAGHEFLANARNERVWEKTKAFLKEKGGAASLSVVVAVAKKYATDHFGLTL